MKILRKTVAKLATAAVATTALVFGAVFLTAQSASAAGGVSIQSYCATNYAGAHAEAILVSNNTAWAHE